MYCYSSSLFFEALLPLSLPFISLAFKILLHLHRICKQRGNTKVFALNIRISAPALPSFSFLTFLSRHLHLPYSTDTAWDLTVVPAPYKGFFLSMTEPQSWIIPSACSAVNPGCSISTRSAHNSGCSHTCPEAVVCTVGVRSERDTDLCIHTQPCAWSTTHSHPRRSPFCSTNTHNGLGK